MESGTDGSAPLPTPKSESRLGGFGGIKKWLEKRGLSRHGHSRQEVLSEDAPQTMSEVVTSVSLPENLVKPEIPIPGVASIPEGNIRLFHFTYPENLDSIRSRGITSPNVDINENGLNSAPNSTWVYSDLNFNELPEWTIGIPFLEFSAPPNEMCPHNAVGKEGTARTLKPGINIPLERIVAIHEPWHEMVRQSNNGVIDPEWLKSYTDRSVQVAGTRGTRGGYTNYSEIARQKQYLESQVIEANKYLNSPDNQPELV